MNNDIPQFIQAGDKKYTFVKKGKVKNVYEGSVGEDNGDSLLFYFTDQISVFDKVIPSLIPRKGEALCRGTAHWFKDIAFSNICETHYVGTIRDSRNQMIVKRAPIVKNPTTQTDAYQIPLEVIARYYAAGSMIDRMKSGEMKPQDVGLSSIPKAGDKLPEPWIDFETKFEEVDRKLTRDEAKEIGGLTKWEIDNIIETVLKIDRMIAREVEPRGLIHADGKKEFAYAPGRNLVLIDTMGTGDEDRFWNKDSLEKEGKLVELSKEFVRQHYRSTGYHTELMATRKEKREEPAIPALSEEMVRKVSAVYAQLHEQLTGEAF